MSDDLVRWLGEQLDEDEQVARAAADELEGLELGSEWRYDGRTVETVRERTMVAVGSQDFMEPGVGGHIAAHDPARVLREIDAKRKILRDLEQAECTLSVAASGTPPHDLMTGAVNLLRRTVRLHAEVYDQRPGYDDSWRP